MPVAVVNTLEARIKAAASAYYAGGDAVMTDAEFDGLVDALRAAAPDSTALTQVGAPVTGAAKAKLPYPMMSLDKVKSGVERWAAKHPGPYVLSDKLDGTSAMLAAGRLYRRGTGEVGADVSHLIPSVMAAKVVRSGLAVRGEIIMRKRDFDRLPPGTAADARSAVNALVNAKAPDPAVLRAARFVAYEVLHPPMGKAAQFAALQNAGFDTAWHAVVGDIGDAALTQLFAERRNTSPYHVDGVVVHAAGVHELSAARNPTYAFAFKAVQDDQGGDTTVGNVVYESSRGGRLVPRVSFEPVTLPSGVTMRWATAHNARFVVDNGIGPGAVVRVVRSGDVIPKIHAVLRRATRPELPAASPAWEWDAGGVHAVLVEIGSTGRVKLLLKFLTALGVEHAKETTLTKLYDAGYDSIAALLAATPEQLSGVPGIGEVIAGKLSAALRGAVSAADPVALMVASNAFGEGIGERRLRALAEAVPRFSSMRGAALKAAVVEVPGFQAAIADKIVAGVDEFAAFMAAHPEIKLRASPRKPGRAAADAPKIVFTGFRDAALEARAVSAGYAISTSVSAKTALLVARDPSTATGKVAKALAAGVAVESETSFRARGIDMKSSAPV